MFRTTLFLFVIASVPSGMARAGIFSGSSDTSHLIDPAIAADDTRFVSWATTIDASRTHFTPGGSAAINHSGGYNSLGDLSASQIAAGLSPGYLTVRLDQGVANGAGHDFAVFENGGAFFPDPFLFAELASVEVSTNGSDFARFDSIALNSEGDLYQPFGRAFAGVDTTNIYNLAGKHKAGFGTPFDLDDLRDNALVKGGFVDLQHIRFIRMVDIPGNGSFVDSQGNPILDAWLTAGSGGFDFRIGEGIGVGILNVSSVPEPSSVATFSVLALGVVVLRRRRSRREAV